MFLYFVGMPSTSIGDVMVMDQLGISFAKGKAPTGVTWSAVFEQTTSGLALSPTAIEQGRPWIQTDKIPVGYDWYCPEAATISVQVSAQNASELRPRVFIRYGCDGIHWSTWYKMEKDERETGKTARLRYTCELSLPYAAEQEFLRLRQQSVKKTSTWFSYEELCRWIARENPGFFASEFPFIGYVQLRLEFVLLFPPVDIQTVGIGTLWDVSGPHENAAKDLTTRKRWGYMPKPP
jgi:hypothetical protein